MKKKWIAHFKLSIGETWNFLFSCGDKCKADKESCCVKTVISDLASGVEDTFNGCMKVS